MSEMQTIEPLLLNAEQTAQVLGISRSKFFSMLSAGKIGVVGIRFDRSVRYPLDELRAWLSARNPKTGLLPTRQQWIELLESQK